MGILQANLKNLVQMVVNMVLQQIIMDMDRKDKDHNFGNAKSTVLIQIMIVKILLGISLVKDLKNIQFQDPDLRCIFQIPVINQVSKKLPGALNPNAT